MSQFGWSHEYVRKRLPGAQGWVWFNWSCEHEATVWGERLERKSDGYVKQERNKWLTAKSQ